MNNFQLTYVITFVSDAIWKNYWSYSINGGAYTALPGVATAASGTVTVDLSGAASFLNGATTINFMNVLVNAGGSGTISFDNIQIEAVPEPINVALALFGVLAVGGTTAHRFMAARKAKKA